MENITLTDKLRDRFSNVLNRIAKYFIRLGFTANQITIFGLFGQILAAFFIISGSVILGGIVLLIFSPFDALDGSIARLQNKQSKFGAFIDFVTDRYAELIIMGALLIYFLLAGNYWLCVLAYFAAAGSFLVPYTRSRAESLGFSAKIGILSRVERYLF